MRICRIHHILCATLATLATATSAWGADSEDTAPRKTTTNSQMIGIGAVRLLDTYLSPEEYSGTEVRFASISLREKDGKRWARLIQHNAMIDFAKNRADNGNEIGGEYRFGYGMLYRWDLCDSRLTLRAGGMAEATVGFLYNTRNGNNPAQARLGIDIAPMLTARYRFCAGKVPVVVGYEASAPLCGLHFSPNFGQSYYEIFSEGDYDHNIVATTFVGSPTLRHAVTADITLGKTTLRVGYTGDWWQSEMNNLKHHRYSNMFMIGITRKFNILKLKP